MAKIVNLFKKNKEENEPELYTEEQIDMVEAYITKTFGEFEAVFHEIVSPDIHVDIAIIPPTEEKNYYTLVTMGMGAHKMNVPSELAEYALERAEIVAYLPPDWNLESDAEIWYWPLRWMKILARLPIEENGWLAFGHTVPNEGPFADNTGFSSVMLISPTEKEREILELDEENVVTFYQMLPLYDEEMNFKIMNNAAALLKRFDKKDIHGPIDLERVNYCEQV